MNEAWMNDIDKITERKELPIVLRKHGFNTTADEYIEMCGALKLYIAQKLEEARKEVVDTIALDQGWEETGDKYRKMYGLPMIYVK